VEIRLFTQYSYVFKNQQGAGALSGADGKFELTTFSSKDSVFPGEYTVFVQKEQFENLNDDELLEYSRQGKELPKPKGLIPRKRYQSHQANHQCYNSRNRK
jgi:hypothetical protein